MKAVEDAFAAYFDRQPNDKERQRLMRGRDAAGIKDNDALWTLLLILDQYQTLYETIPSQIAKAASDVTNNARAAAEGELKAAAARTHAELAKSVAQTARDIAGRVATENRSKWVLMTLVLTASVLVAVGASMFHVGVTAGRSAGEPDGSARVHGEKAAAAWANSPDGQLAIGLANAGSLRDLATCTGKGWVRKGNNCFVKAEKSAAGWRLGGDARRE